MIALLDCEASGLHANSYPTEVAWCDSTLQRGASYLIRPPPVWVALPWSSEAEVITGITQSMLQRFGRPPEEVACLLNEALAGTKPITDAPWIDGRWLTVLHHAAGVPPAYGICPMPPTQPGWLPQMDWAGQKAPHDLDARLTRIAHDGRLSASAVEHETTRLRDAVGLVEHRALDDAICHALALGVVTVMAADNDAARRQTALTALQERAKVLLAEIPRPGRF